MKYIVGKTDLINPDIFSREWNNAELGYVDIQRWPDKCHPEIVTTFKILRGPEGISILMHTNETNLLSDCKEENGQVCDDSCMEFFYKPSPWDERYLNFEVNPDGVMMLGIGNNRFDRKLIFDDRKIFDIVSVANDGDWTVKYYIPDTFINYYYNDLERLSRGNFSIVAKGNFYKCGGKTDHPHLAAWSEIKTKNSDFHVPDFFGEIIFE